MKKLAVAAILFYRKYLSHSKMLCCRFYPSCSEYAIQAIERRGLFFGSLASLKRLFKCHPLSRGGYDPVE